MVRILDFALLAFGLQAITVLGQLDAIVDEEIESPPLSSGLAVTASASFPNAEIFGIKLVNGKLTEAIVAFVNEEPEPITVQFVGGSLWSETQSRIVRNLTTAQYAVEIPPGEKQSLPYRFQTNMHPQDLRLNLAAVVSAANTFYTLSAFNGTVSIVEPDSSIFDPQILFLYVFLLACTIGVGYFFYAIWIVPYFPQKRKAQGKRPERKKVEASPTSDSENATTTGKSAADDWLPAHHTQRPEARRIKSGARPKSRGKPE